MPDSAGFQPARCFRMPTKIVSLLIDGHNDLPWAIRNDQQARGVVEKYDLLGTAPGQTDFRRLAQGGIGGQFWSVYIPGEASGRFASVQLEQIAIARRMIELHPDKLRLPQQRRTFARLIELAVLPPCWGWKAAMAVVLRTVVPRYFFARPDRRGQYHNGCVTKGLEREKTLLAPLDDCLPPDRDPCNCSGARADRELASLYIL